MYICTVKLTDGCDQTRIKTIIRYINPNNIKTHYEKDNALGANQRHCSG